MRKIQIIRFANRVWSLDDKKLAKKAMKVQILDVKGRFNWVSEMITIMRENNINRSGISNIEISKKLQENFISILTKRLQSFKAGKKLRTYALFKQDIKFEPYLNVIKNKKYRVML